jgi:hypothetical protein
MRQNLSTRHGLRLFHHLIGWIIVVGLLLAGIPALLYGYHRWFLPQLIIRRTIRAFEMQNATLLYSLSHPLERQQLNVTPQTLQVLMQNLFLNIGQVRAQRIREKNSNHLGVIWWEVEWERMGGSSAPGAASMGNTFVSSIDVVPSAEGWKAQVVTQLVKLNKAAIGRGRSRQVFFSACRQAGIKGFIDYGTHIFWIPSAPQPIRG